MDFYQEKILWNGTFNNVGRINIITGFIICIQTALGKKDIRIVLNECGTLVKAGVCFLNNK